MKDTGSLSEISLHLFSVRIVKIIHRALLIAGLVSVILTGISDAGEGDKIHPMRILVYPFQCTGDSSYNWLSAGITDTVISRLGMIKDIDVFTEADRKRALKEIELGMTGLLDEKTTTGVGKLTGANLIFTGSYQVAGNRIRVSARLFNVEKGLVESTIMINGSVDDIFEVQDKIVAGLIDKAEKAGLSGVKKIMINESAIAGILKSQKPDKKAFELYSRGLAVMDKDPRLSLDYFSKSLAIQDDYIEALVLSGYISGVILNRYDEAIVFFGKAEKLFSAGKLQNSPRYFSFLRITGIFYLSRGDLKSALEYLMKAKEKTEKNGMQESMAYLLLLDNMGTLSSRNGDNTAALSYHMKSKEGYEKLGMKDTRIYSGVLNNIGIIYENTGRLGDALSYYLKSKDLDEKHGLRGTRDYLGSLQNIGHVYSMLGNDKKAMDEYTASQKGYEKCNLDNTVEYSNLMMNIALLHHSQKRYDDADKFYLKSKKIFEKLNLMNSVMYANLLFNIAINRESLGDGEGAGKYFRQACESYSAAGYTGDLLKKALENAERLGH